MAEMGEMPFDSQRMIFSGFDPIGDKIGEGKTGYADGYVLPVPNAKKEAYIKMAEKAAPVQGLIEQMMCASLDFIE